MICGDSWSEDSGNGFKVGSNSMWVLSTGKEVSLVYLCAQLFLFQKQLQYKPMDMSSMVITGIGVPMVESILTFRGDQKLGVNDLSFVTILFILEMDPCFIS